MNTNDESTIATIRTSRTHTGHSTEFCIKVDPANWQQYISTPVKGRTLLMDPFTNKGTAFTAAERDELDLHGLLPPVISTMEEQLQRTYEMILGETLDKRNFRRRILEAGIIEPTPHLRSGEGRPARLYRYRPDAVAEVKARRLFP
jgi:hypothetical protein